MWRLNSVVVGKQLQLFVGSEQERHDASSQRQTQSLEPIALHDLRDRATLASFKQQQNDLVAQTLLDGDDLETCFM